MIGYAQQIYSAIKGKEKPSKIPGSLFWQNEAFGITGLEFDLLINETHGMQFDVSEHVIENGETISDHVRRHLRKVTIVGLFTNHPLNKKAGEWIDEKTGEIKKGQDKIKLDGVEMTENAALVNYEKLQEIASARKPVTLTSALEVYENMVITSLRVARGPEDGEAIKFEMELSEVKSISLVNVKYDSGTYKPKTQDRAQDRAAATKKDAGNVSAQDVDAEDMAKDMASANQGEIYQP